MATATGRRLHYEPRDIFQGYHARTQRWAAMVAHRRAGKTVATIGDICHRALFCPLHRPQYGYIAPQYNQAKRIAWNYLKDITAELCIKAPMESSLSVELHNGATVSLFGADNPDSFRGLYFDGTVLDEYGNMPPSVWSKILRPTLLDRQGWATFIGTPNGPNHFRDQWRKALQLPRRYYSAMHKASQTGLISDAELLEMKDEMTPEEYLQEMECSFEAATRGAFYAAETTTAEQDGRVLELAVDKGMPLHFVFDLGWRDDTTMWCWQDAPDGYRFLKTEAANRRPIMYYIRRIGEICEELGVPRGKVYLPHDAKAKSLQTARSIVEQFMEAEIIPEIVPSLGVLDGIAAARMIFKRCHFDADGTEEGFMALKSYHREYDEIRKIYKDKAEHDWSSHYADGFRYFALVARSLPKIILPAEKKLIVPSLGHFTMDQAWSTLKTHSANGRV